VQAVARAVPPSPTPWYNGNALVATMPGCHPPAPHDAFTLSGSSVSLVTGAGGVFVNSECSNAFTANGGTQMDAVSGICVVGGVVNNGGSMNPPPDDYCASQIDDDLYVLPSVGLGSCPSAGQYYDVGGMYVATPGYYDDPFPNVSPAERLLQKGIYCFKNGLSPQADRDYGPRRQRHLRRPTMGIGVLFYVHSGSVTSMEFRYTDRRHQQAGTDPGIKDTDLSAAQQRSDGQDRRWQRFHIIGTILAPSSHITSRAAPGDHPNLSARSLIPSKLRVMVR
jgi:hypothetical protein